MSNANIRPERGPRALRDDEFVALKPAEHPRVLRDDELDAVSGGKVSHGDLVITKLLDAATPKLF